MGLLLRKQRNVPEEHQYEWGYGDVWTWVALDPDTKLVCSWLIGRRDSEAAMAFLADLGPRLRNRVQITTDGHRPYIEAIEAQFGQDVDYAMLIKYYGIDPNEGRFSPPKVLDEEVRIISGNPDPDLHRHELRRAQQPKHADGHASFHPPDQRLLQEGREPCGSGRTQLHVHELRPPDEGAGEPIPAHPGDGGWHQRPHLDVRGDRGAARLRTSMQDVGVAVVSKDNGSAVE